MNNLDGFLKKFRTALGVLGLEKKLISEELSVLLKVAIPEDSISIKSNRVIVSGGSSLKSQIFLKKSQVLEAFQKHPELKKITDVV